jgi:CO/xanthine dehydrogenase Mo-binding subunit
MKMPGMLYIKTVFARVPHAIIKSIDTSEALKQPGVIAVFTSKDVPHNIYGLMVVDTPVFCDEVVRYVGDRIAAVVAETPEQALAGAKLVRISYEELPVLSDPYKAMEPDAIQLHDEFPGNIAHTIHVHRGDVDTALAKADIIIEHVYHTPRQEHVFLEPEAGLGFIDEQGNLTVYCAGQAAHDDRRQIASALGIDQEKVRVIYPLIGGSFGGREDISVQIIVALAAWKLQRPVKIAWSREESMIGHGKRHPMTIHHTWGAMKNGKIIAAKVDVVSDAGAHTYTSGAVLDLFYFGGVGAYDIPNVSIDGKAVLTNNIPSCAFRGFGIPQALFSAEMQIERVAERLGIDPVTIRMMNCLRDDSTLPTRSPLIGKVSLSELLEKCAIKMGAENLGNKWEMPSIPDSLPNKRRGIGLAIGFKTSGLNFGCPESSEARVELFGSNKIEKVAVHTACNDVGQGSYTALAQIAAEELGVGLDRIEMITGDTADVGDAGMSSASRLTILAGNAVRGAARLALKQWEDEERPAAAKYCWHAPITTSPDPITGACIPAFSYTYVANGAEVEVDIETGEVKLLKIVSLPDPGITVNPQMALGQVHGGVIQAAGWTLLEDFIVKEGKVLTDRLSTYLIPTALDIPDDFQVEFIENPDPIGPYGVRGLGESPFIAVAPAIVSAVHDAIGEWFVSFPLKPERVLARIMGFQKEDY